jgi:hypothetical protein
MGRKFVSLSNVTPMATPQNSWIIVENEPNIHAMATFGDESVQPVPMIINKDTIVQAD